MPISWLAACPGEMEPFKDHPSTHGHFLTSLRSKPQQKQPRQLSAQIPKLLASVYSYHNYDGETCVLLLCALKPGFLKSSHIYVTIFLHD